MKNNKKPTIISLEGAPFAGKTTLLNYLKQHYSNELIVIPEASEYIGGDKNNPSIPFNRFDDAKASTYFFLELEKQRILDARALALETGLPVILDRSTPIFSLIFYKLLEEYYAKWHSFTDSFFDHAKNVFNQAQMMGEIIMPSAIVYLKPKNKMIFVSRIPRGANNNMFTNWDIYLQVESYYKELIINNYALEYQHKILYSENNTESLERMSQQIVNIFFKLIKKTKLQTFDFLELYGRSLTYLSKKEYEEEKLEFIDIREKANYLINNVNVLNNNRII